MGTGSSPRAPGAALFACNFNRVRSPMAEALAKRLLGDRVYVDSCGLKAEAEAEGADPFVRAVMAELGFDLEQHQPKTFDLIISLTPEAQHRAVELTRHRAAEIEYWPTHDPTLADGSRENRLAAYREVRDALARRLVERFGPA